MPPVMTPSEYRELRQRLQTRQPNDDPAWGEFDQRFAPEMYQYAHHLVRNWADAKEVVQESLRVVSEKRALLPEASAVECTRWLRGIVHNETREWKRKNVRRVGRDTRYALQQSPSRAEVGAALEAKEAEELVWRALGTIREEYRECFLLRYFEELSVRQIADRLGTPEGTICSWLNRARIEFRQALQTNPVEASSGPPTPAPHSDSPAARCEAGDRAAPTLIGEQP